LSHEITAQDLRRTFRINIGDLALYWGGDAFASAAIVLPLFVSRLTDSTLAVGLIATLYGLGLVIPQIAVAGYVRNLRRKKWFAIACYAVQRLSFFLLALATLTLGDSPALLLPVFFVLYLIGCAGVGAGIPAHQDVIAKIVPVEARGRLRGTGIFIASLIGVGAGLLARSILEALPFDRGFALCFFLAALLGTASLGLISFNREPAAKVTGGSPSFLGYLRELPGILAADANFRRFLYSRILFSFSGLAVTFLPVFALVRFGLETREMGTMTAAMMAGQLLAVLALGFVSDRRGHKVVLEVGSAALVLALALALAATSPLLILVTFALAGCSNAAVQVSTMYIAMEFAPPAQRPTYIALGSTIVAPTTIVAPLLGGWLAGTVGYPTLFLVALAPTLAGLAYLRLAVHEPRRQATWRVET
jgi:MFS family permease